MEKKFFIVLLVIMILVQPQIVKAQDIIQNPSFEDNLGWIFSANGDNFEGNYSIEWASEGTQSYKINIPPAPGGGCDNYPGKNAYAEVYQDVDLSSVSSIVFDLYTFGIWDIPQLGPEYFHSFEVWINETIVLSLERSSGFYYNQLIDTFEYQGVNRLAFRFQGHEDFCSTLDRGFHIDNLRVTEIIPFNCDLVNDVSEIECEALVSLYNRTNGQEWLNNENWLETSTVGNWHGVKVDSGHVTYLYLWDNNLFGTLPPELGNLTYLKSLELGLNQLTGEIPSSLGDLELLENLTLIRNHLTGSIPEELGRLSNLRALLLYSNNLSGSIPPELGDLSGLVSFGLSNNNLSGSIPSELANISNLPHISLESNFLTGSIPPELGGLMNLSYLNLGNNLLTGIIPPELCELTKLKSLYLQNNYFSGVIPENIGNLINIERINLSNNDLSGDIPESITNLENLEITVYGEWDYVYYGLNLDYNWFSTIGLSIELEEFLDFYSPSWRRTQGINVTVSALGGIITSNDETTEIIIPEGAVESETDFFLKPQLLPTQSLGSLSYGGISWVLTASASASGIPLTEFLQPLTVRINYDEGALGMIDEDSLVLYYWDEDYWIDVVTTCFNGEYTRDFQENWFSVPVCHLSEFAVFGEEVSVDEFKIYLPLVMK